MATAAEVVQLRRESLPDSVSSAVDFSRARLLAGTGFASGRRSSTARRRLARTRPGRVDTRSIRRYLPRNRASCKAVPPLRGGMDEGRSSRRRSPGVQRGVVSGVVLDVPVLIHLATRVTACARAERPPRPAGSITSTALRIRVRSSPCARKNSRRWPRLAVERPGLQESRQRMVLRTGKRGGVSACRSALKLSRVTGAAQDFDPADSSARGGVAVIAVDQSPCHRGRMGVSSGFCSGHAAPSRAAHRGSMARPISPRTESAFNPRTKIFADEFYMKDRSASH